MSGSTRKAEAAMRRHVAADLEHQLVAVAQKEPPRVAADVAAVAIKADPPRKPRSRPALIGCPQTRKTSPSDAVPVKLTTPLGSSVQTAAWQRAAMTRPNRSRGPRTPIAAGTIATRRNANSSRCTR